MNLAIIGAGPSGLAAARAALQHRARVFVFDRFVEVGGLMRYGVGFWNAPLKDLQDKLLAEIDALAQKCGRAEKRILFRPYSNIGKPELDTIASNVDGMVLACGGKHSEMPAKFASRPATVACQDFVGYYNNAPWIGENERDRIGSLLSSEGDVVIVGFGNVALDAITFLKMHQKAKSTLNSPLKIHLVGRGCLNQAKWTKAVLREALNEVQVVYCGLDDSSFGTLPRTAVQSAHECSPVTVYIHDEASVDYIDSETVSINYSQTPKPVLCRPKLLLPCLGFAEPAIYPDVARIKCPVVRVGWCATNCRGDVGSAIVSGKAGVRQLFSTMTTTRKTSVVPFGHADEWSPLSSIKKLDHHAK